jgi:hypothetical protein
MFVKKIISDYPVKIHINMVEPPGKIRGGFAKSPPL